MKIIKSSYKCSVCGTENEYFDYMSNSIRGYSDFDMKPVGSMRKIGANIMECPNCHYANYKINTTIDPRLVGNLELWNNSSEFQEIIENYSGVLRKILLVAKQYENNLDYLNAYKTYIMASWVSDDKNASNFRIKASELFMSNILPIYNTNLLQIADILRMEGNFNEAIKIVGAVKELTEKSDDRLLKILHAETEFIKIQDIKRHNLSEILE